jgi:hypothetical protein
MRFTRTVPSAHYLCVKLRRRTRHIAPDRVQELTWQALLLGWRRYYDNGIPLLHWKAQLGHQVRSRLRRARSASAQRVGHHSGRLSRPLSADTVVKVVLHWGSEILRAAGATFV